MLAMCAWGLEVVELRVYRCGWVSIERLQEHAEQVSTPS